MALTASGALQFNGLRWEQVQGMQVHQYSSGYFVVCDGALDDDHCCHGNLAEYVNAI